MKIISFLSDFGLKDNFVGLVKAIILKINPSVQIVDISHQISPHDIIEAAFILKSSFGFFPKGTIHLAVVDPTVGSRRKALIVKTNNFYFVAPDNGLLSLVLKEERVIKIVEITNSDYFLKPVSSTFHSRDIFAPIVGYLSRGEKLENFGREISNYNILNFPSPIFKKNILEGEIVYIDWFGNLVTNIDEKTFKSFIRKKSFKVQAGNFMIDKLSFSYTEGDSSCPICLIDSFGYLEISMREKNASKILRLDRGDKIKIQL
ncbi:MAG: SAM-dependent chlorinase/fluorinase [Candidatus Omnitrophica bacterium]|nr:SAM-dependent chlorinase/fluorinase [Candidatus Omnitrophota bacterium]